MQLGYVQYVAHNLLTSDGVVEGRLIRAASTDVASNIATAPEDNRVDWPPACKVHLPRKISNCFGS